MQVKLLAIFAVLAILVLGATVPASAGTANGTTTLLGPAISGSSVDVDVSVVSTTPVVPYEYAIQNECWFSSKTSGPPDSYQQDDIVNWIYSSPAPYGNVPHAIMTVYLNTVPAGSTCKVFLVKGNTLVKGSMTKYPVE
jgi:hypothetical protein